MNKWLELVQDALDARKNALAEKLAANELAIQRKLDEAWVVFYKQLHAIGFDFVPAIRPFDDTFEQDGYVFTAKTKARFAHYPIDYSSFTIKRILDMSIVGDIDVSALSQFGFCESVSHDVSMSKLNLADIGEGLQALMKRHSECEVANKEAVIAYKNLNDNQEPEPSC